MESSAAYEIGHAIGTMVACALFLLVPAAFLFALVMALTRKTKGWIIGAVASGLLGLLLIGGILAAGVSLGIGRAKADMEVQVFASPDGLYTISGASGWRVLDLEAPDATLKVGSPVAEEYLMVIPEKKSDLGEEFGLVEFSYLASEGTAELVEEAVVGDLVEEEIGGHIGYRQELSGTVEGIEISYLLSYVEGKNHFYQIIAWTLTDRKEKAFPKLRAAGDTFAELATP